MSVPKTQHQIALAFTLDQLEQTQRLLQELVNGPDGSSPRVERVPFTYERRRAEQLVGQSRLFRPLVRENDLAMVAATLDDIERVLVEIAHLPEPVDSSELKTLRRRVLEQDLLFKIRLLRANLTRQQQPLWDVPRNAI